MDHSAYQVLLFLWLWVYFNANITKFPPPLKDHNNLNTVTIIFFHYTSAIARPLVTVTLNQSILKATYEKIHQAERPLWHWFQISIKSHMVRVKWSGPDGWTQLYSPSCHHWLHWCLDSHRGAGTRVSYWTEILPADLKKKNTRNTVLFCGIQTKWSSGTAVN